MIEIFINRLKSAETQDWLLSRPSLRKAILTNDLGTSHLVDIVANIIDVWLLIVSYLKETGRINYDDSPVVRSSFFNCFSAFENPLSLYL